MFGKSTRLELRVKNGKTIDILGQNVEDISAKIMCTPFRGIHWEIVKIFKLQIWLICSHVSIAYTLWHNSKWKKAVAVFFFYSLGVICTLQTTSTKSWLNNFWMENTFHSDICLSTILVSCFLFVFHTKYIPSAQYTILKLRHRKFLQLTLYQL